MSDYYPWIPYPAIPAFSNLLQPGCRYWEWGAGASTIYAASRKVEIWSVEHDPKWFYFTASTLAQQQTDTKISLIFRPLTFEYCQAIKEIDGKFDLIFIDGRLRVDCCRQSVEKLSPGGIIVLDNSDRPQYEEGINFIKSQGFTESLYQGRGKDAKDPWRCSFFRKI